jgi:hypothetical protein
VEDPELVARIAPGETAPRETVKVGTSTTITETETVEVLDNVAGAIPVEPVIVRVKLARVGTAAQLTDNMVPETLAVQPVKAGLVEKATVPAKPLIATNDSVEV